MINFCLGAEVEIFGIIRGMASVAEGIEKKLNHFDRVLSAANAPAISERLEDIELSEMLDLADDEVNALKPAVDALRQKIEALMLGQQKPPEKQAQAPEQQSQEINQVIQAAETLITRLSVDVGPLTFDPDQPNYEGAETPTQYFARIKRDLSVVISYLDRGDFAQVRQATTIKEDLLVRLTTVEHSLQKKVFDKWKTTVEINHPIFATLRVTTAQVLAEVPKPGPNFGLIATAETQLQQARGECDTNFTGLFKTHLENRYLDPAQAAIDQLKAKQTEENEKARLRVERDGWWRKPEINRLAVALQAVLDNAYVNVDNAKLTAMDYTAAVNAKTAIQTAETAASTTLSTPFPDAAKPNPAIERLRANFPNWIRISTEALTRRIDERGFAEWDASAQVAALRTEVGRAKAIDINTQISPQNGPRGPNCFDTTDLTTGTPPGSGFQARLNHAEQQVRNAHLLNPDVSFKESQRAKRAMESLGQEIRDARANLDEGIRKSREKVDIDPSSMSLDQLADAIISANIDVYDHGMYNSPQTPKFFRDLYAEFHKRKSAILGETVAQMQSRIDFVMKVVLTKAEDVLTNEGQVPTATRPEIFHGLVDRQVSRHELLKATTYHPEYGTQVRFILDDLITRVADRNPGNEISYDVLTGSGEGKTRLTHFIKRTYRARLMGEIYQGLPTNEREKKVDEVLALCNRLYILFDLMTVSFAELQKQTKTSAHQKTKKGVPLKDKDRVLLTRPDAALVHRMQRYDSPSDWSANWLLYMNTIPADYGKPGIGPRGHSWRDELVERQKLIRDYQASFYDVEFITGTRGIPTSTLFEPTFPDTRSFLLLADSEKTAQNIPEMLEFGDRVYGTREDGSYGYLGQKGALLNYGGRQITLKENIAITAWFDDTALTGWEKIIELTFGDLPSPLSEHTILESSITGGSDPDLGMIDVFINKGCSMAKMFPGNHMRDAVPVLFTHYIMRIFARYQAEWRYKEQTLREVVKKLQNSTIGGGLAGYPEIAINVIRNITANSSGLTDAQLLAVNASRLKMSENLDDGTYKRMRQRKEYLDELYKHKRMRLPAVRGIGGGAVTSIASAIDSTNQSDQRRYHAMLNGEQPLEDPGVNRRGSIYKVDKE